MTDLRERLIEFIMNAVGGCSRYWAGVIADGLMENGVGFGEDKNVPSKWIPVTERPPEEMGCYFITVKRWLDSKPVTREAYWNGADWLSCERRHELTPRVTHWMPLPEPPKEDA